MDLGNRTTWFKVLASSQSSQDFKVKVLERRETHRSYSDIPSCFLLVGSDSFICHTRIQGWEAEHSSWQSHRTGNRRWLEPGSQKRKERQRSEPKIWHQFSFWYSCWLVRHTGWKVWKPEEIRSQEVEQRFPQIHLLRWLKLQWKYKKVSET